MEVLATAGPEDGCTRGRKDPPDMLTLIKNAPLWAPTGGGGAMSRRLLFFLFAAVVLFTMPAAARAVSIGDKAPLFTAASDKGEISLERYLGEKNVIIAFYFAINTPA